MSKNLKLNSGILKDVGHVIDDWLDSSLPVGWAKGGAPHFSHKSTYLALLKKGLNESVNFSKLIQGIDARIRDNLDSATPRRPSAENWRFEARPVFDRKNNKSPEVRLERAIVGQRKKKEWANQSPVASGLLTATSDKGRHVDLVREVKLDAIYELIELKWHSDNPFFAAMEILCYSLIFLLYREKFPQTDKCLLNANTIHLGVLAPSGYYQLSSIPDAKQTLLNLQSNISAAVQRFAAKYEVKMDFRFWEIPNCGNPKDVSHSRLDEVAKMIVNVGRVSELPSLSK